MDISVCSVFDLASADEITKYPNSPLIKSETGKSVLVLSDGFKQYILGYITKGDTSNTVVVHSQYISGSYGHVLNDMYNSVQNSDDLSTTHTRKNRTVLLGNNQFIGSTFHDGVADTKYGFKDKNWSTTKDYGGDEEAPVAPNKDDEHHFISLDNGNKFYQSASGSLHESNAIRVNVGVGATDIHSYGIWDKSTLSVETPIERLARSIDSGTYASGARIGFPDPSTYHIYNFVDNSSFMMGNGIIEIEKASADNTTFAKTVYDENGVLVEVDENSIVTLKVKDAEFIIDQNNIHIKGATLNYDGDLYVSGKLTVSGSAVLEDTLGVTKATTLSDTVGISGKLTTTGGSDLA